MCPVQFGISGRENGLARPLNNAEKAFQLAKVHDKISGTSRRVTHMKAFAKIRSYPGTADTNKTSTRPLPN